jgi:hypothetical protein
MEKKLILNKIKTIFDNNDKLIGYSPFLCCYLFDCIFECHIEQYIGCVDETDKDTIKNIIEKGLDMSLNELMTDNELDSMYILCLKYIKIMINEKN